MLLELE